LPKTRSKLKVQSSFYLVFGLKLFCHQCINQKGSSTVQDHYTCKVSGSIAHSFTGCCYGTTLASSVTVDLSYDLRLKKGYLPLNSNVPMSSEGQLLSSYLVGNHFGFQYHCDLDLWSLKKIDRRHLLFRDHTPVKFEGRSQFIVELLVRNRYTTSCNVTVILTFDS